MSRGVCDQAPDDGPRHAQAPLPRELAVFLNAWLPGGDRRTRSCRALSACLPVAFGRPVVFDEAMSELDHVTINAFVADDHTLFALETIDDGENNPFTIGHYIWRIDDLLQHFPPHAFVQPTDPSSVAGGAILASLIFPDRVPWFVFRALDQLKVLSG